MQEAARKRHQERWQRQRQQRQEAAEAARERERERARLRHRDRVNAQLRLMHRRAAYYEANIADGKQPHVTTEVLAGIKSGLVSAALDKLKAWDERDLSRMRQGARKGGPSSSSGRPRARSQGGAASKSGRLQR